MAAVEIDFNTKTATVTCKPGSALARTDVAAALPGGYGVTSFEVASPPPTRGP